MRAAKPSLAQAFCKSINISAVGISPAGSFASEAIARRSFLFECTSFAVRFKGAGTNCFSDCNVLCEVLIGSMLVIPELCARAHAGGAARPTLPLANSQIRSATALDYPKRAAATAGANSLKRNQLRMSSQTRRRIVRAMAEQLDRKRG